MDPHPSHYLLRPCSDDCPAYHCAYFVRWFSSVLTEASDAKWALDSCVILRPILADSTAAAEHHALQPKIRARGKKEKEVKMAVIGGVWGRRGVGGVLRRSIHAKHSSNIIVIGTFVVPTTYWTLIMTLHSLYIYQICVCKFMKVCELYMEHLCFSKTALTAPLHILYNFLLW